MHTDGPGSRIGMIKPLRVRVAIPHYFRETAKEHSYGSGRQGASMVRRIALGRCLGALINLQRSSQDLVLNIGQRCLNPTGPLLGVNQQPLPPVQLDVHIITTGCHRLDDVLGCFAGAIQVHEVVLEDPRTLALAARNILIRHPQPLELALYLEDDLVISDPLFFDKQAWFLEATGQKAVLMPHRYEQVPGRDGQRLLVDGPLRADFIGQFTKPEQAVAHGRFWNGEEICFDRTANPHAGLFCLSRTQVEQLQQLNLANEGFVGPMETAATLTALAHFQVLKPSMANRGFLWVEHGHPSFHGYANSFAVVPDQALTGPVQNPVQPA